MDNPEITSDKILSIISDQWLTNDEIANELGLENSLDKKYLSIKLKELDRKEIVLYEYDYWYDQIYWRKRNPEEKWGLNASFALTILEKDPFDAEMWNKLGEGYLERHYYKGDTEWVKTVVRRIKNCFKNALWLVNLDIDFQLFTDIVLNLAMMYNAMEKLDKAHALLDLLLRVKEELEEDTIGLMHFELAQIYFSKKMYDKALNCAMRSKDTYPGDSTIDMLINQIKSHLDPTSEDQGLLDNLQGKSQEVENDNQQTYNFLILQEMKKQSESSEKTNIILMKSYINQSIRPFLDKPSNRKLKKLESLINSYKEGWPDDMWDSFVREFHRALEVYKALQPSKWHKWGSILLKIIPIIH